MNPEACRARTRDWPSRICPGGMTSPNNSPRQSAAIISWIKAEAGLGLTRLPANARASATDALIRNRWIRMAFVLPIVDTQSSEYDDTLHSSTAARESTAENLWLSITGSQFIKLE